MDAIITTDWMSLPLKKQESQEHWDRYVITDHPLLKQFTEQVRAHLPSINSVANTKYTDVDATRLWIDLPGFTVPLHLDGVVTESGDIQGVSEALQCFWLGPADTGTEFYNGDKTLRYKFPFRTNTGYFMLLDPDLWHGMTVENTGIRITTYTYFIQ